MLRILLHYLLPFLLPFLVYTAYLFLVRGRTPGWLSNVPWAALSAAGVVLVAIGLATWTLTSGSPPEEASVPPRFEDGQIIPGATIER